MAQARAGVTVARPIDEVFAVITDVEKTGTWFPVQVEEHWTSPPPHGIGSTRHAEVTILGRRSGNDTTVTAYDPPRHATMSGAGYGLSTAIDLDLAPVREGTRIDAAFTFTGRGVMRLVVGPFLAWYRGQWERGLRNLKRMMEAGEL